MEQPMRLDEFRDAIATLHVGDSHVGHLATTVEAMRSPLLFRRQERVWLLLTRLDGTVEIDEDYAPWCHVRELRYGCISWASHGGAETRYDVRWLTGEERERAWLRYGLVDDVGAYLGGA